ncbi:MAG: hypothetical protein WA919_09805 [Coleofasciculaceae cyanobacterium]
MKILIALVAVAVIFYLSSLNWRHSVKALLFILVIEGALRKWVLPQASDMIYFLKDLVLLGAYLKYYAFSDSERKIPVKSDLLKILIFLVTGWCSFQAFNPSLGSPIVGIFGLKAYLFYIPLMWMLPNLFTSEEELRQFVRSYLLLVIPIGILGIVQYFSPISSPINAYAPGEVDSVAAFNGHVRITGTFSYIGGYAIYLIVSFALLIPLLSINQPKWWRLATIAELLLVTVNSFMSGSRGVVFAEVLFLLGYLAAQGFTRPASTIRLVKQFLLPVIVVSLAASIWFQPAIDNFVLRATSNSDVSGRITNSFSSPLEFAQYKGLDGYGIGSTLPGGRALRSAFKLPPAEVIPVYFESEMGRITLEIGPIGFLLWYGLRVSLLVALWLVFWQLKRPFLRQLALTAFLIHLIQFNGQLIVNHTVLVYYWFLSGFIFLLPRLEQIENWHRQQQLLQQNVPYSYLPNSPYQ